MTHENIVGSSRLVDITSSSRHSNSARVESFIRLNGILFTRTSLETFTEVLAVIGSSLREILSSGESEGQTYIGIVQHAVLLQNAFTAAFELMDHKLERCAQLPDPSTSYLLPGILVFIEWLACYPDLAAGNDVDKNQAILRSKFWNH
ncbi:hypothetical protein VNO77_14481 [Canavalia gladiata]|uniref:DNA/RNA-binding domain-containing protein n=1 Tax=Canavalia gladiata TaxID=3824 RepID=A0AAN9QNQ9_CANGL